MDKYLRYNKCSFIATNRNLYWRVEYDKGLKLKNVPRSSGIPLHITNCLLIEVSTYLRPKSDGSCSVSKKRDCPGRGGGDCEATSAGYSMWVQEPSSCHFPLLLSFPSLLNYSFRKERRRFQTPFEKKKLNMLENIHENSLQPFRCKFSKPNC